MKITAKEHIIPIIIHDEQYRKGSKVVIMSQNTENAPVIQKGLNL